MAKKSDVVCDRLLAREPKDLRTYKRFRLDELSGSEWWAIYSTLDGHIQASNADPDFKYEGKATQERAIRNAMRAIERMVGVI